MYVHVYTYTNAHIHKDTQDVHMADGTTSGSTLKMLSTSSLGASLIHQLGYSSGPQGLGIISFLLFHTGNKLHRTTPSLCVWVLGSNSGPVLPTKQVLY